MQTDHTSPGLGLSSTDSMLSPSASVKSALCARRSAEMRIFPRATLWMGTRWANSALSGAGKDVISSYEAAASR